MNLKLNDQVLVNDTSIGIIREVKDGKLFVLLTNSNDFKWCSENELTLLSFLNPLFKS